METQTETQSERTGLVGKLKRIVTSMKYRFQLGREDSAFSAYTFVYADYTRVFPYRSKIIRDLLAEKQAESLVYERALGFTCHRPRLAFQQVYGTLENYLESKKGGNLASQKPIEDSGWYVHDDFRGKPFEEAVEASKKEIRAAKKDAKLRKRLDRKEDDWQRGASYICSESFSGVEPATARRIMLDITEGRDTAENWRGSLG